MSTMHVTVRHCKQITTNEKTRRFFLLVFFFFFCLNQLVCAHEHLFADLVIRYANWAPSHLASSFLTVLQLSTSPDPGRCWEVICNCDQQLFVKAGRLVPTSSGLCVPKEWRHLVRTNRLCNDDRPTCLAPQLISTWALAQSAVKMSTEAALCSIFIVSWW